MSKITINNFVDGFVAFLFAITGPVAIILSITSTNNIDLDLFLSGYLVVLQ